MYKIERTSYGFKLTFGASIKLDEMQQWVKESHEALRMQHGKFGVLVDMRTLKPLLPEVQNVMVDGQKQYKEKGMERSAVILDSALLTGQFKRLAQTSGIYQWERYIDASSHPEFEKIAIDWIVSAKDPDNSKNNAA